MDQIGQVCNLVDIIVPVYQCPELTLACLDSIWNNLEEIQDLDPRIIIINDSGENDNVGDSLQEFALGKERVQIIVNEANIGFVKSVNRGLSISRKSGRAVILINSDTVTFPGTLKELCGAAKTDPQIGFACPRSNNASISTFPRGAHALSGTMVTPDAAFEVWSQLKRFLPRITFAPTAVGFYLYIASSVVANFGRLNEAFSIGYEEENDMIMRANKVGYRAVIANHAFAYHQGSASFILRDIELDLHRQSNLEKLTEMHPEFLPSVRRYEYSPSYRAEELLKNLIPDEQGRLDLVFNLLTMGQHHNGTNELAKALIRNIADDERSRFNVYVLSSYETYKFHGFDKLPRVRHVSKIGPDYAVAVFPGQPFDLHYINIMESLAPVVVWGMLDMIALDCQHISYSSNIDKLWQYVADTASGIFYISNTSKSLFENRFEEAKDIPSYTRLLPTRLAAYSGRYAGLTLGQRHVLVMGNQYLHKDSIATGRRLRTDLKGCSVCVIGEQNRDEGLYQERKAGEIPDDEMNLLFSNASVVVFPSYYEGFGFGMMHALSIGKPVVARNIAATEEIISSFGSVKGVCTYSANAEVADCIMRMLKEKRSWVDDSQCISWKDWSDGFVEFVWDLVSDSKIGSQVRRRLRCGDMLRMVLADRPNALPVANVVMSNEESLDKDLCESDAAQSLEKMTVREQVTLGIKELMVLDGADFVRAAYVSLLGREPDIDGLQNYLSKLTKGCSKRVVLSMIKNSAEGRTKVLTLDRSLRLYRRIDPIFIYSAIKYR